MIGWIPRTLRRLKLLSELPARERAMDEEIRFHIEMEAADLERRGVPKDDALRRARVAFGGVERFKEVAREARGTRLVEELWQDLRYALRQLGANQGFAAATVITLGLGIGATTMMYSSRRSLAAPRVELRAPERLLYIGQGPADCRGCVALAPGSYQFLRERARTLDHVSLVADWEPIVRGADAAEPLDAARVTPGFFETFDERPILGRTLTAEDAVPGRDLVVVLSESLWTDAFARDPEVLGRTLVLDRLTHTVVGVVTDAAGYWPRGTRAWTPLVLSAEDAADHMSAQYRAFARLRDGATAEAAAVEVAGIGSQLAAAFPGELDGTTLTAGPLLAMELSRASSDPATLIFRGAVGLVLVIACINLAGLLVARLSARRPELAMRRALGASTNRVVRQLVTETVLLTGLAALAGVSVAVVGTRLLLGASIPLDFRTFGLALSLGVATGLFIALLPSLRIARPPVLDELRGSGRLATGAAHVARRRRMLVGTQIALTIVVLAAAGALARSFQNIYAIDPGFSGDRVLALRVRSVPSGDGNDVPRIDRLVETLAALPGVEGAGATLGLPFGHGAGAGRFEIAGRPPLEPRERPSAFLQAATPTYFDALGVPVLRGRAFREADAPGAPPVAVVNRAFVERYLRGDDPIGQGLVIDESRWEIVGVVADLFHGDVEVLARPEVYRPLQQWGQPNVWIALRTRGDLATVVAAADAAIGRFDPDIAVTRRTTVAELRAADMGSELHMLQLMTGFAAAALLISAVGLYGLISYSVAQRGRELGVRIALGASRGSVVKLVLAQALRLVAAGTAIGMLGAAGGLRLMHSMLFGVSPVDPLTLGGVILTIGVVAVLAAWAPARRATLVDPVRSLGQE